MTQSITHTGVAIHSLAAAASGLGTQSHLPKIAFSLTVRTRKTMPHLVLISVLLGTAAVLAALACRRFAVPQWRERWLGLVEPRDGERPGILFYAASHGELLLLEKLLPRLRRLQPEAELMVLAARPSVLEVARQRLPGVRAHCVTPLVPGTHRTLLTRLKPDVFVVLEFARIPLWVLAAQQLGIPLSIVNGRISLKHQRACHRWPWLMGPMLAAFDQVLAQTADDAAAFRCHGARESALEVAGALKFEAAATERQTPQSQRLARLAGIADSDVVLLAGSTHGDEVDCVAAAFQKLVPRHPNLRLILVPRSRHRFERAAEVLRQRGLAFQRRSDLDAAGADPAARVLLVDSLGELAAWWGLAHIGFVGATLVDRGGHNMIEPAALGVATCFGPHTDDFRDVVSLLLAGEAAAQVANEAELLAFVQHCLDQPAEAAAMGARARAICRAQAGAMQRVSQRLCELVEESRRPATLPFPSVEGVLQLALRRAA